MRVSTTCLSLIVTVGLHLLKAELAHGQAIENTYVNIEAHRVPLRTIFSEIEGQTNFLFVFPIDLVNEYNNISMPGGRRSVKDVLDIVMNGSTLGYTESNATVSIFELKRKIVDNNLNGSRDEGFALVTGTVRDVQGDVMAGVNVVVKGTSKGTVTDAQGRYSIEAMSDDWLVFTFIGFAKEEVQVGDRSVVDVAIKEDATTLDVVEVGPTYYKMPDKLKTANIARVSSKEISGQPITSPLLSLQGRVAGLEVSPVNGAPGVAPKIRIRGENSLRQAGGNPLFVVDGVIIDSAPLKTQSTLYANGGIDPLANISPENIESIDILKDADATAIYGSRGANGVILITTKHGNNVKGVTVDANVYYGVGQIPGYMDLLNTQEYLAMRREAFVNSGSVPSEYTYDLVHWDTTRYTDWQKELLDGTSKISDAQLSFSGGNNNTTFRFGGGYHKETTFISDDLGYERASVLFSFNHMSSDQKLSISFSANYGLSNNKIANLSSLVDNALNLPPNAPALYQEDGSLNWQIVDLGFKWSTFNNPMADLRRTTESNIGTIVANSNISYEIFDGLTSRFNIGYTDANGDEVVKEPISAFSPADIGSGSRGTAYFSVNKRRSWIFEPQLNFTRRIGRHGIDALIGSTFQESNSFSNAVNASGYLSDLLLNSIKGASSYSYIFDESNQYRYMALFARLGYNWDEKYLINLTARRDGSSRFGPGNRFGNFGAVGAAWIFSEERAFKDNLPFINFGKIRMSYGTTGNDLIGDYEYYSLYTIDSYRYQNSTTLQPNGLFNRNFNWEVTSKFETSIELSLLRDRLSVQTSWYRNRSSNQLVEYQLPATTGFESILTNFNATIENRGWEFVVQTANVRTDNFRWTTSLNLSFPKNELIDFPGIESSPYADLFKVGEPISVQNQFIWGGVDPETGIHIIEDVNNDGLYDNRDRRFGNSTSPRYYGGVLNSIRYKSFDLSFLFQFAKQIGVGPYINYPGTSYNQPKSVLNRWKSDGDITNVAKFSSDFLLGAFFPNILSSDYNTVDASYIRLKTLSISYELPFDLLNKSNVISQVRLYIQGQNLLTFSSFVGLDPETGARSLPQMRMFTGGVQVKF